MATVRESIKNFVIENFLFNEPNGFNDDTSFLEEGIIDSTGILELLSFIEEQFSLTIEDDEVIPENLDSVNNIVRFIEQKG